MRDKNVEYMMNDAATVIAVVQEGDLWSYSPGNEKVIRFSVSENRRTEISAIPELSMTSRSSE